MSTDYPKYYKVLQFVMLLATLSCKSILLIWPTAYTLHSTLSRTCDESDDLATTMSCPLYKMQLILPNACTRVEDIFYFRFREYAKYTQRSQTEQL